MLKIEGTDEFALALRIGTNEILEAWRACRRALDGAPVWPLVVAAWGPGAGSWEASMHATNVFSRTGYGWELGSKRGLSADAIVSASTKVDITRELAGLARERATYQPDWTAYVDFQLGSTVRRFGSAPETEELLTATIDDRPLGSDLDADRWLLGWEIETFGRARCSEPSDAAHLQWFEPRNQPLALVLVPVEMGAECLAFVHWFAAGLRCPSPVLIALLRSWQERFGAELVAHYGTMLEFIVSRKPQSLEEAWELAVEQILAAPCTTALGGVTVRDHARALLHSDRWFLHERP